MNAVTHRTTLKPLEDSNTITKTMASRIAKSGLNYDNLKTAFDRSGFDGIASFLGEKVNGVVRINMEKFYKRFMSISLNCKKYCHD